MSEELKACPFCGEKMERSDTMYDMALCSNIDCWFYAVYIPVRVLNSRPIEDELRAELEKRTAGLHDANAVCMEMKHELDRLNAERRWIPASERLPEYGEPSLTIYHTKNATSQITIRCLVEDRDDKLRVIWYDIENGLWVNGNNITHWMPLPEPPNADDYVGDSDHEHDDRIL